MTSEIVKSVSIENLVAKRDRIVARVKEAHRLLEDAEEEHGAMRSEHELAKGRSWHLDLVFSSGGERFTSDRGVQRAIKMLDTGF